MLQWFRMGQVTVSSVNNYTWSRAHIPNIPRQSFGLYPGNILVHLKIYERMQIAFYTARLFAKKITAVRKHLPQLHRITSPVSLHNAGPLPFGGDQPSTTAHASTQPPGPRLPYQTSVTSVCYLSYWSHAKKDPRQIQAHSPSFSPVGQFHQLWLW